MPDTLMLTKDRSKLLLRADGKLAVNSDCCCKLAILVYNSNSQKDDNFSVKLNGTEIGQIDNSTDFTCTGRIFAEDTAITAATFATGISCVTPSFQATLLLNMALVINGANTLRVESIQNNGNGNFGAVKVLGVVKNGANYSLAKTYLSSNYNFLSGVGNGNNFSFNYP